MPFAAQIPPMAAPSVNETLRANTLICPIGIRNYKSFPDKPVRSATRAALCWWLQGLRLGTSSTEHQFVIDEDPTVLKGMIEDLLKQSDLPAKDKQDLQVTVDQARWGLVEPTFKNLLVHLMYMGNHLEWHQDYRLLVPFIGHGTICQGRMVLCPSDIVQKPAPVSRPLEPLLKQVENAAALWAQQNPDWAKQTGTSEGWTNWAKPYPEWLKTITPGQTTTWAQQYPAWAKQYRAYAQEMMAIATAIGVVSEVMDLLTISSNDLPNYFRPPDLLAMVKFQRDNLKAIQAKLKANGLDLRKRAAPEWGNVITGIHWALMFGPHAARMTLILDACHAGGLSDSLQGSQTMHDWIQLGVLSRIYSASQKDQQAAEAAVGDRLLPAATWALTSVLSRWERVADGPGYALGIRNGDLVLRANMLLEALSFTQQIALHAPAPTSSPKISASDMPFYGLFPETRTTVDPSVGSDGIQLSSDTPSITSHISYWEIRQGNDLKAALLAVGSGVTAGWTYNYPRPNPTITRNYPANSLTIFSSIPNVNNLANNPGFTMKMVDWDGNGNPPPLLLAGLDYFVGGSVGFVKNVQASNDPNERLYQGDANPAGVVSWQGNGRKVYIRWIAPDSPNPRGKFHIISKVAMPPAPAVPTPFPFNPNDFASDAGSMSFATDAAPGFTSTNDGTCKEHIILL